MKFRKLTAYAAAILGAASLAGCGAQSGGQAGGSSSSAVSPSEASSVSAGALSDTSASGTDAKRLSVVCTNFAEYDFARAIAGEDADVSMLLKPGAESHSYEPTPDDIITIQNSDLFVYVGGDSDAWVSDVLSSMDQSKMNLFRLMDQVDTVAEETVEGMQEEEEEEEESGEPELDEHVWTSPKNAAEIVNKMAAVMEELDPSHKDAFASNASSYSDQIMKLDEEFRSVIESGVRKEIIVADRFPFRYFCEEFGLTYYGAFPGCSTETQPSAKTVAFLTDKVKEDNIPVVFHIELSNEQMADSIAEATGAKSELLNAVHNVSDKDFKNGETYVSLMEHNVDVLKEALN